MGQLFHIYCDESRQTNHQYMVLAGIIIESQKVAKACQRINTLRKQLNMMAELKWTKVSKGKLSEYIAFVDLFFDLIESDQLHFHAMILDTHQFDHQAYNQGNKEIGFYKFYYQLLLHKFGGPYCTKHDNARFLVFPDYRNTNYKLADLKKALNNGIAKNYKIHSNPWRNIEPIADSKECDLLQLVDIITGSIGYVKNHLQCLPNASLAKKNLAEKIRDQAKVQDLGEDTPRSQKHFTIWNFRLKKRPNSLDSKRNP